MTPTEAPKHLVVQFRDGTTAEGAQRVFDAVAAAAGSLGGTTLMSTSDAPPASPSPWTASEAMAGVLIARRERRSHEDMPDTTTTKLFLRTDDGAEHPLPFYTQGSRLLMHVGDGTGLANLVALPSLSDAPAGTYGDVLTGSTRPDWLPAEYPAAVAPVVEIRLLVGSVEIVDV